MKEITLESGPFQKFRFDSKPSYIGQMGEFFAKTVLRDRMKREYPHYSPYIVVKDPYSRLLNRDFIPFTSSWLFTGLWEKDGEQKRQAYVRLYNDISEMEKELEYEKCSDLLGFSFPKSPDYEIFIFDKVGYKRNYNMLKKLLLVEVKTHIGRKWKNQMNEKQFKQQIQFCKCLAEMNKKVEFYLLEIMFPVNSFEYRLVDINGIVEE